MKSSRRPELGEPTRAFAARLAAGDEFVPLRDFAAIFGPPASVLTKVSTRGDIRFADGKFVNDGPELVVEADAVELEIPNLMSGTYRADESGFTLEFPNAEFTLRACARIAILRKCFDLRRVKADAGLIEFDFGNGLADRRYEFDS